MGHRVRRVGLRGKLLLSGGAMLLVGLLAASPAAAAPANDNFGSAQTISGPVGGSNVGATKEVGEPNHAGDEGGASVWYKWTAPSTGVFNLNTCGSKFDTLLAAYKGSAVGSLTPVVSNDDSIGCSSQSRVAFHATSGTTYRIAVDGYSGGESSADTGDLQLHLGQNVGTPFNDSFASPSVLSGATAVDDGSNVGAASQAGEPNDPGAASVWYSWTAPASGVTFVDTCFSEFDTLLGVYTGNAIDSLTFVATDNDGCGPGGGSALEFNAIAGTTYRIAVDGSKAAPDAPAEGAFELFLHLAQPPANDNFASPQLLFSGSSFDVSGRNTDATVEPGEPSGFVDGPLQSVWYAWRPPESGQFTIDTCASDFDTVLTVFTGNSLNSLTRVASNDNAPGCGSFGGSKLILNVNGGTTYRIAVDGYFEQGSFQLRLGPTPGSPVVQQGSNKDSKAPNSKVKKVVVDSEHGKAKVTFGSSESGSKFKCKLDRKSYKSCHSPKTYRHLDAGKHKIKVQARDAAGNLDPTPAVRRFRIES